MGAGASSGPWACDERSRRQGLGELPESCVASVLLHLDPREICGMARLNRAFRAAATADFVWESKLPESYVYLLEKVAALDEMRKEKSLSKKEIYAMLCHQNRFDGGKKILLGCITAADLVV